jgi:hypothetical protein
MLWNTQNATGTPPDTPLFRIAWFHKIPNQSRSSVCRSCVIDNKEREIAIDPRSIQRHYRVGRSICVSNVQLRHEPLRRVVAALKAVLGLAHEIGFASYLSPTQQGIPLHCDRHEVFILQIEGEKEWRYARAPSVAFPLAGTQPANAAPGRAARRIQPKGSRLPREAWRPGAPARFVHALARGSPRVGSR